MNENDITIMQLDLKPRSRLYYYQGNFYHPLELPGRWLGVVKKAIRDFTKENKKLIDADRSHPDYKSLLEIFDEQFEGIKKC